MPKILFVDDEPNILKSVERLFSSIDREIATVSSGLEAIEYLEKNTVSVLVTDQRMPGMSGLELISYVKKKYPSIVRIILSGYTDLSDLLLAINNGEIFKFLVKPWDDNDLVRSVDLALMKSREVSDLLSAKEGVLLSLAETIELKDSYTKGHCDRVAFHSERMALELGVEDAVVSEIRYGAWLHDCGKIGIPDAVLNKPEGLTAEELLVIHEHPVRGGRVAERAKLSKVVVDIIQYHHERIDGLGYPYGLRGDDIPFHVKIVSVADVFDALATDRPYRTACGKNEIIGIMQKARGEALDSELVDMFLHRFAFV